jgi:hypothetical protein
MMRKHWIFSALILVISFAACGEDFAPYNRLGGLRVLAIQADPPTPAAGEASTFTPLVYTPGEVPDPTLVISWSWCPFAGPAAAGYPCLVTEEQLGMLAPGGGGGGGGAVPPFDLGTGPTASFTHNVDPALLARLCAGVDGSPQLPDCEGGFPVQVKMIARTDSDEVMAVRTLRLPVDAAGTPNTNPTIDGLAAVIDDAEQSLSDDPAVTLPRAVDTTIRATVGETAAEGYTGKKPDGTMGGVRETLTLTWFI